MAEVVPHLSLPARGHNTPFEHTKSSGARGPPKNSSNDPRLELASWLTVQRNLRYSSNRTCSWDSRARRGFRSAENRQKIQGRIYTSGQSDRSSENRRAPSSHPTH